MNANSFTGSPDADSLPPWAECSLFCIRGYAEGKGARCGWRGQLQTARRGPQRELICPRCGGATLLRIPPAEARG